MKGIKYKTVAIALIFSIFMNLFCFSAGAESLQGENAGHVLEGIVPDDSMYYNGHTYLAFQGDYDWYQAKTLCDEMGGYLVTLETNTEQTAAMGLKTPGWTWTGACALTGGYTRTWVWEHTGEAIGIMHEPVPGVDGDEFYYTPLSDNVWDATYDEPNSWITPWDQTVAVLCDQGLNTLMPSDRNGFICEFDSICVFSVVDLNFDMNYNYEHEGKTSMVWIEAPASYSLGLPQKASGNFGKSNVCPNYPNNEEEHYNFKGYSLDNNSAPIWLNSEYALHMENSKWYIYDKPLEKPVVTFYAVWEKADTTPSDLECFAASMFSYAKKIETGKTVSEILDLPENLSWTDIDNDLPRFTRYGHVSMRDFMNAEIGGYVVDDLMRYDEGSTFSAVYIKNANGQGIIAYRGTEKTMGQSIYTDLQMGFGTLNVQFGHALKFYNLHKQDEPLITGHSLGGSLAVHVGIVNDIPCFTINGAEGFSISISLIGKYGTAEELQAFNSFGSKMIENLSEIKFDQNSDYISFEDESSQIFSKYGFYRYESKLHAYVNESDKVSLPNRNNIVTEVYTGEKVDPITAHGIERLINYDEETNEYSIVQTVRQYPKEVLTNGDDVPSAWAYDAYEAAANEGLISPEIDRDYQGETNRADFCRASVNFIEKYYDKPITDILKEKNLSLHNFSDTDDVAIQAAAALGITSGTDSEKNLFSPDGLITREQAATMLTNILKVLGTNINTQSASWSDSELISSWSIDSVNAMYNTGVMKGVNTSTFSPKSSYTHEQSIVTLSRLWDYLHE